MVIEATETVFKTIYEEFNYIFTFANTITQVNSLYVTVPTSSNTPLVMSTPVIAGKQAQVNISGGSEADYFIVFCINDNCGNKVERALILMVRDVTSTRAHQIVNWL